MITIRPNPEARVYNLNFPLTVPFKVDLYQSLENKVGAVEMLTSQTAVRALKSIKWESEVKAFLSQPLCVLFIGIGLVAQVAVSTTFIAMALLKTIKLSTLLFVCIECAFAYIGGSFCGLAVGGKEMLLHLSADHSQQAAEADAHIRELTAHPERGLRIAPLMALA